MAINCYATAHASWWDDNTEYELIAGENMRDIMIINTNLLFIFFFLNFCTVTFSNLICIFNNNQRFYYYWTHINLYHPFVYFKTIQCMTKYFYLKSFFIFLFIFLFFWYFNWFLFKTESIYLFQIIIKTYQITNDKTDHLSFIMDFFNV